MCIRADRILGKLNELAMVLQVNEDDQRCPLIAGMEEVSTDEVLRPRDCILTNKPYPLQSFRDGPRCAVPPSFSRKEIKQQVFYGGRLVCRVVSILISRTKGAKAHSGVVRQLYSKESDANDGASLARGRGASRRDSIQVNDDEEDNSIMVNSRSTKGKRRSSFDSMGTTARKRLSPMPGKEGKFVYADVFCGAGGASEGATQAGFFIKWGLDMDDEAIQAYQENHPGALPFRCNAHNFPPRGHTSEELRIDVLHLSPPCCYFSPAQ
jgi:DNA (cytosine-5)-methyltransferase 1